MLMAYGGPDSLDDVPAFMTNITGGRQLPPHLIEDVRERYRLIGGKSPLLELTWQQATALEQTLNATRTPPEDIEFRTYVGMKHWHPFIKDTFRRVLADGVDRLVGIPMAPQYSVMSGGTYVKQLQAAQAELDGKAVVSYIESWNDHPLLLQAFAEKIQAALFRFPPDVRPQVQILFTAHSLPEHILDMHDPYPQELHETVAGILKLLGPVSWHFAYQSQGHTREKWLGPEVGAVLEALSQAGHQHVLLAPVGFICDHVEVLYDIDIMYKQQAHKLGLHLARTDSLNTSPRLIEALADIVRSHLEVVHVWPGRA